MTDVWTSIGVILGVALVAMTGWERLDPLIALAVAVHILWIGGTLIRRSIMGLLDAAVPETERRELEFRSGALARERRAQVLGISRYEASSRLARFGPHCERREKQGRTTRDGRK